MEMVQSFDRGEAERLVDPRNKLVFVLVNNCVDQNVEIFLGCQKRCVDSRGKLDFES